MRSFVIAALMTTLVAGLGFAVAPKRPAVAPIDASEAATAPPGGDAADVSSRNDTPSEPAAASRRVFYQWTDERGSVRFARSLDEVPPAWRERAGQIEVDTSAFEPKPTTAGSRRTLRKPALRAETAERRRDFHDVTVYTAPWCGWCRKTLAFLDQRGVEYVNKDIEADEEYAAELHEKSGGRSIPFVEIDGTQIRGYNPGEMAALLE